MLHHPSAATNRAWAPRSQLVAAAAKSLCCSASRRVGPPGMAVPVLMRMTRVGSFQCMVSVPWAYDLGSFFIRCCSISSLGLFYRLAPRRPTRFAEVWVATLCATVLLRVARVCS